MGILSRLTEYSYDSKLHLVVLSLEPVRLSRQLAIPPIKLRRRRANPSSKLALRLLYSLTAIVLLTGCFLYYREWRERRDADVARRAEISNEKKEANVKKAREDIDDFYVSYNNKADKLRAQTHADAEQFLSNREDTSAGGTSWERIAKLVDVSGKGTRGGASGSGKERFRELLLDLRKDQSAPGVSGV